MEPNTVFKSILDGIEDKCSKSVSALKKEFQNVRTGRANPKILDNVRIDYYGNLTPVNQVGNVNVPDPQMITIVPWEKKLLAEIEKAILRSDLGITPQNDGNMIKLPFPPLNEERRKEMARKVKLMAEDHKTVIRNHRRDANNAIKELEKGKSISEDESKKFLDQIQKKIDSFMADIDKSTGEKENELLKL